MDHELVLKTWTHDMGDKTTQTKNLISKSKSGLVTQSQC